MIVGIDEVGRGPWAGPLVVGAVVLGDIKIDGLTDSKKLTKARREELSKLIIDQSQSYGLGWVEADEIDKIGLCAALTEATKRALEQITVPYHEIIIDGTINFLQDTKKGQYVTTMKKADLLIASVSAASVLAKVARDDYMADLAVLHPAYGFESHVGYGTAKHRAAIETNGVLPAHRKSFAPIAALMGLDTNKPLRSISTTNKYAGNKAETAAEAWLGCEGYKVLERNWKTRFCEIDIIAHKNDVLFFVEVKHRKSTDQGGGLAAITPRKLRQMRFAATLYLTKNKWQSDARLAVVTTTGTNEITIERLLLIE
ncbi:MAG: ribonuclease HII [Patescibacteria group bacterium]